MIKISGKVHKSSTYNGFRRNMLFFQQGRIYTRCKLVLIDPLFHLFSSSCKIYQNLPFLDTHTRVWARAHTYTNTHTHIHKYTHIETHKLTHTQIHTHTHTHIYIYIYNIYVYIRILFIYFWTYFYNSGGLKKHMMRFTNKKNYHTIWYLDKQEKAKNNSYCLKKIYPHHNVNPKESGCPRNWLKRLTAEL